MRKRLTDIVVRQAKPDARPYYFVWDEGLPGFGLRVHAAGRKTFVCMYGANRKRVSLGHYPAMQLAEARDAARRVQARVMLKGATKGVKAIVAVDEFLEETAKRNRKSTEYARRWHLTTHFVPGFGGKDVSEISYRRVMELMRTLKPGVAPNCYSNIRALFSYCVQQGYLEVSPLAGKKGPRAGESRERVLNAGEMKRVLTEAFKGSADGDQFYTLILLLAFTGQRRGQFMGLRNDMIEIDLVEGYQDGYLDGYQGEILFPPEIMKGGKPHRIPMVGAAAKLINRELESGGIGFQIGRLSKRKDAFDLAAKVTDWTLHDLRRTFSTICGELDQPREIVELIMDHRKGFGGVRGVYDRHNYMPQMKAVLEAYDAHLLKLADIAT